YDDCLIDLIDNVPCSWTVDAPVAGIYKLKKIGHDLSAITFSGTIGHDLSRGGKIGARSRSAFFYVPPGTPSIGFFDEVQDFRHFFYLLIAICHADLPATAAYGQENPIHDI
ncbi:MAG: hypothetical protein IIA14_09350, partial [SAR324 cluster bacterium]|nr:hypothetical protein [SAR324 cluster bacterium]